MAISRLLVEANQIVVTALCDKANGYEQVTSQQKVVAEQKLKNNRNWRTRKMHEHCS